MTYSVVVRHNFEAAHRLPHLGGKCANIHGHSWRAEVMATSFALHTDGTVVEFGAFKARLREWIDTNLDHGSMLSSEDRLLPAFLVDGTKVFRFGLGEGTEGPEALAADLPWPTTEAVAVLIERVAHEVIEHLSCGAAVIDRVLISETGVNSAEYRP